MDHTPRAGDLPVDGHIVIRRLPTPPCVSRFHAHARRTAVASAGTGTTGLV